MKTNVLKFLVLSGLMVWTAWQADAQCKKVGLIGEFTGWAADLPMARSLENPDLFTVMVTLDVDSDGNGVSDLKFRELGNWGVNWGSADFPAGTASQDGANVPVPFGTYYVTFNCSTGEYNFEATCPSIGLIGEFTGWAADFLLDRDPANPNHFTGLVTLDVDSDENGVSDLKFREEGNWGVNWGSADFPAGTGVQDGANIPVPMGTYLVSFDCSTGEYNFESTCPAIGLIGEFTGWAADFLLERDPANPNHFSGIVTLDVDSDGNGVSDLKFREEGNWGVNWGSADFPAGTGVQDGANIPVPMGTYHVGFDCSTGAYTFTATCGEISMIGAFNGWNGDVEMTRDATDPNLWTLYRSWNKDSEVKFRQNKDWVVNWGTNTWPTGTATPNGPNIPLVAGKYDVSFNCANANYSFTPNDSYCGEIGMVGDFNDWGLEDANGFYTDQLLKRDPNNPNYYTLTYTFSSGTNLLFREDGDLTFTNVWGGSFPSGTGVMDPSQFIQVPGGTYTVTFDCQSGDFNFERLGSSIYAPKVFAINVDGSVSENDWRVNEPISKVLQGDPGADPVEAVWGAAYTDEFLYVAGLIKDASLGALDGAAIAVDGDKSGGDFDAHDMAFAFDVATATVIVQNGPAGYIPTVKTAATADGWAFEAAISWAQLGVTPAAGSQIGMEIVLQDLDGVNLANYIWNGDGSGPSTMGSVNLGTLSCGQISLYSDLTGDVALRPTSNDDGTNTNTYVGTYQFENAMSVVFRKDNSPTVAWGAGDFPAGTATVGGASIPATAGRYRVSFGCLDGEYSFTPEPADDGVAYSQFTQNAVTIDGNLGEYQLTYGMNAGVVAGAGPDNNTVTWGSVWDANNVYFGVSVLDATVEGSGNPWDNDAIEFYFDGNHDSDGTFDPDFDTQIIMDIVNGDTPWVKADGVQITDIEGKWQPTASGYNIELRIGWADFGFVPARNRTMGFTVGNNDSDNGIGRDYQTAWYGTGNNWNNTADHGDLQLAGGFLGTGVFEAYYSDFVTVYPNPANAANGVYLTADAELFSGNTRVQLYNLFGQLISEDRVQFEGQTVRIQTSNLTSGNYFIHLMNENGNQAVKQIIIE